jgi:hypothetical protein
MIDLKQANLICKTTTTTTTFIILNYYTCFLFVKIFLFFKPFLEKNNCSSIIFFKIHIFKQNIYFN